MGVDVLLWFQRRLCPFLTLTCSTDFFSGLFLPCGLLLVLLSLLDSFIEFHLVPLPPLRVRAGREVLPPRGQGICCFPAANLSPTLLTPPTSPLFLILCTVTTRFLIFFRYPPSWSESLPPSFRLPSNGYSTLCPDTLVPVSRLRPSTLFDPVFSSLGPRLPPFHCR